MEGFDVIPQYPSTGCTGGLKEESSTKYLSGMGHLPLPKFYNFHFVPNGVQSQFTDSCCVCVCVCVWGGGLTFDRCIIIDSQ